MRVEIKDLFLWFIGIAMLFPLFFLLSGEIYNSSVPIIDSRGDFSMLPLPISILACFGGLLLFIANYQRASLALKFLVVMLFIMLVSLILIGADMGFARRKIILLLQFIMPAFGLVFGQLLIDRDKIIPRAFLYVLLLVVPIQLVATWLQGHLALTHYLYLFSIYSHFQYVPLIFVCAYAYSMTMLWESHKKLFYLLTPLMLIYAVASISLLTNFAFFAFIIFFTYSRLSSSQKKNTLIMAFPLIVAMVIGLNAYHWHMRTSVIEIDSEGTKYLNKFEQIANGKIPSNAEERLNIWRLYIGGVTESGWAFLFGHAAPLPREIKSSAHNWYLDMLYNFGFISLLPIFMLIGYTTYLLFGYKKSLSGEVFWLAVIVFYLVVVDNNFKVSLRQPYPGIFAYFLWGLLLSRLVHNRIEDRRPDIVQS